MFNKAYKLLASVLLAIPTSVLASDFPSQALRIIVPYSAGGSTDAAARILATGMSKQLSQPVIVENKPGAGGIVGTMAAKNAPADGYTVLITSASHVVSKILQPDLQFDIEQDFVPLSQITQLPIVLVVSQSHQAKTLPDLLKMAKAAPGTVKYGTAGVGTIQHVSAIQMLDKAKIEALHVPYKGGAAAVTDVIGGELDFTFAPLVEVLGYLESGRLRALGVTTVERSSALPNVPTIAETLPGYESFHWNGFVVKRGTPATHVKKLAEAIVAATKDPEVVDRLRVQGTAAKGEGPQSLAALIAAEKSRLTPLLQSENGAK